MQGSPVGQREHRRGIVLLSTLVTLIILASLIIALQQRAQANVLVMARLTAGIRDQLARDSINERLRGLVADQMTAGGTRPDRPKLDGTPFVMAEAGRDWTVRVQDVEGLVDIYLANRQTLGLLPVDAAEMEGARQKVLAELQPGERFPDLASSLARFGVDGAVVAGMVTQSGQTGAIRLGTMPMELRAVAAGLTPGVRESEQVNRVVIEVE